MVPPEAIWNGMLQTATLLTRYRPTRARRVLHHARYTLTSHCGRARLVHHRLHPWVLRHTTATRPSN